MNSVNDIDDYIDSFPKEINQKLKELRALIKKTAPKAEETISYGMPAYKLNGPIIYFAAFKNHIGIYPTASPIVAFKKELKKYKTSKGAIQIPIEEPIPKKLITDLIKFKIKENADKIKR